ncbi:MAG: hypothetical protein ACXWXO_17035 [Nocardioides sp.]
MKSIIAASAVAAVALVLGASAPAAAVPETELRPAKLERGDDVAIPHLEGKTVVDGDVRVEVKAGSVSLLGKSGSDYVVGAANSNYSGKFRALRYTPEGDKTVLFRDVPIYELELSDDGAQITSSRYRDTRTRVRVFDAVDGAEEASRWFNGSVTVLDLDAGQMLLGGWSPNRTFRWAPMADTTQKVVGRVGYEGDLSSDRLATVTKDPYLGGCSIVSTVSSPGERLWGSCKRRVDVFSPSGTRMATIHILSDGIGPSDVWLHDVGDKPLAHYTAAWFGILSWESDESLLLDTNGKTKSATVRCLVADCERASDLRPRPRHRYTSARFANPWPR